MKTSVRRILSFLLVITTVISLFTISNFTANANSKVSYELYSELLDENGTYRMFLKIRDLNELTSCNGVIYFNKAEIKITATGDNSQGNHDFTGCIREYKGENDFVKLTFFHDEPNVCKNEFDLISIFDYQYMDNVNSCTVEFHQDYFRFDNATQSPDYTNSETFTISKTGVAQQYLGDVDFNGSVTAADARLILRHSAQLEVLSEEAQKAADTDSNGSINAADARFSLRISAQLETPVLIKDTPAVPETTTATPETTTVPPEPSTAPPEPSTAPPEPSTAPSEPSTTPPEPTTLPPETTTAPPETTTAPPEPTTGNNVLSAQDIHKIAKKYTVEVSQDNALGSGFFISDDGKVVTNYHVIENAKKINVTDYEGKTYPVTHILAYDKDMDIAVLKTDATSTAAVLNKDTQKTGDVIYTLGSSQGLTDTFTDGIISNPSRVDEEYNPNMTYIQFTAPITNGNSGGPLINSKGEVIGINSWGISDGQNMNFAIPVSYIDKLDYTSPKTMDEFAGNSSGSSGGSQQENAQITVTENSVVLSPYSTIRVRVDIYDYESDDVLKYSVSNSNIQCIWSDFYVAESDGHVACFLFISAYKKNITNETVTIFMEDNTESSVDISVSVDSENGSIYYSGDARCPDFGYLFNVMPTDCVMNDDASVTLYQYDAAEIPTEYKTVGDILDYYEEILEICGYTYYSKDTDNEDVYRYYYKNGDAMVGVSFLDTDGDSKIDTIMITMTPS